MKKTHLLEKFKKSKDIQSPCWIWFQRSNFLLLSSRSTCTAVSLCLNRDEPSGPGNLALIQLQLKAKQLIHSLAEAETQLAHKAQTTMTEI